MTSASRLTETPIRVNPVSPVHVWRSPAGADADILIVTDLEVYSAVDAHAREALPNETGGFLLGTVGWDAAAGTWIVRIDEVIVVEPLAQTPVHFTFSWRDVDRARSRRERAGKALVGWYHTHPDMGIFLSETDVEKTHRVLFSEPFQVALVYDPVGGRAGYFFWEGPQLLDPSAGAWREFQIALRDDGTHDKGDDAAPVEILLGDATPGQPSIGDVSPPSGGGPDSQLASDFRIASADASASIPRPGDSRDPQSARPITAASSTAADVTGVTETNGEETTDEPAS